MKEENILNLINENKIPLIIDEYYDDYSDDDLSNDLYIKNIPCDGHNELVYCDNDICYYECQNGDYLYIDTQEAIGLIEYNSVVHNNSGLIRVTELAVNYLFIDEDGAFFKNKIANKYANFPSIKNNCYIDDEFKEELLANYQKSCDLSHVRDCVDYDILKENLNDNELEKIDNVLQDFISYQTKFDDGKSDIYNLYTSKYGNSNIICWYEGITDTQTFIEEFISYERGIENEK